VAGRQDRVFGERNVLRLPRGGRAAFVLLVAVTLGSANVSAASSGDGTIHVGNGTSGNNGGAVTISVGTPGGGSGVVSSSGSGAGPGSGGSSGGGASVPDPCHYTAVPVADKNLWAGYDPTKGSLYTASCPDAINAQTGTLVYANTGFIFAAKGAVPAAPPNPAVLAAQVERQLNLPVPTVGMDPDPYTGYDSNKHNMPYTLVNVYTWFWDKAGFAPLSKTAALNGVSATATATPTTLRFDPGDGSGSVTCTGPGREWRKSDGFNAPSGGGCGFMYRRVTAGDVPIKATLTVSWTVSWTGSTGAAGTLPPLSTTTTTPAFLVEQVEVVNR